MELIEKGSSLYFSVASHDSMSNSRPSTLYLLMVIEAIIGLTGLSFGVILFQDPTGIKTGMNFILPYLPIPDYNLLALWFLTGYGLLPLYITYALYVAKPFARTLALGLAGFEVVWILAQFVFLSEIGMHPMQPLILGQALLTAFLLTRSSIVNYLKS